MARGSSGRRRRQQQWARDLERELRALPTTDPDQDVGPDGGPVDPLPRHTPAPPPPRRARPAGRRPPRSKGSGSDGARRRTVLTVLLTLGAIGLTAALSVGPGAPLRELSQTLSQTLGLTERPGGGTYAFLRVQGPGQRPVGWDPCEPVPFVVDPAGAPDSWPRLVAEATAAITEASGLRFEDRGTVADRDFAERDPGLGFGTPEPALIAWADEQELPALAGDVAGLATTRAASQGNRDYIVTGSVVLATDLYARLEETPAGRRSQLSILMHELGHLVGLDHFDDPQELMYDTDIGRPSFGEGDLEGLRQLGAIACR